MSIRTFIKSLYSTSTTRRTPHRGAPFARLSVELLEDRWVPAFLDPVSYAVGTSPRAIVSADFNNDNWLDLATADSNRVSVLLGAGGGTFGGAQQVSDISDQNLAVGDFNGDGNADLVGQSYVPFYNGDVWGRIVVQLGDGFGSFSAAQEVAIPEPTPPPPSQVGATWISSYAPSAVRVRDVNGDGKSDLGVEVQFAYWETNFDSLQWGSTFVVLLGTANGSFQVGEGGPEDFPPYVDGPVVYTFLNGDSFADEVTAYNNPIQVRLGQAGGTFAPAMLFPAGLNPSDVTAGDFNRDGRIDVAVSNAGSNDVSVLLNDGDWSLPSPPDIRIGDVTVTEGNAATRAASFTVTLSAASSNAITVAYATADGTALAGSDYQAVSGTVTFAPGEMTKTVAVMVNGDASVEPDETFHIALTNADGATIADGQGVGTIVNDDVPLPNLTVSDVSKKEGRNGTTTFSFTVTLSAPSSVPVTVQYATADGTATVAGHDYFATSGSLTFQPGQTSKTITALVRGDRTLEADEAFFLNLANSQGAWIGDGQGLGMIENDDGGAGGKRNSSAATVDAAISDWFYSSQKKRR